MAAKQKKIRKSVVPSDAINFKLPESLTCSNTDYPIVMRAKQRASWNEIILESTKFQEELKTLSKPTTECQLPMQVFLKVETDFIVKEVFGLLIPAIEETLRKAVTWGAFSNPKSFFNGVDHIAEYLWNNNPRHAVRKTNKLHIFNMPWVKEYLKIHPRKWYPKSWLWTEEYACIFIQKCLRGYFVRREPEVQEMRIFWQKLKFEENNPGLHTNPFLRKRFASCDVGEVRAK